MLVRVYGDQALSMKCVYEWFTLFQKGQEIVSDNLRSERLATSFSDENIERERERERKSKVEKARSEEQQYVELAPTQRLDAHCALCKTVLGGQTHYCARESTVLIRSRTIRLLPDS
ncbi:hypothetical protein TNCV_4835231 [Trichonephila clavipes]|nr:hypothetical protein TNCV_4835231 [Trichonephila clavipes]